MMERMYDAETVRGWISGAEAEVSRLTREAEQIQFRLADARRRLMLLYEVLASVTSAPVAVSPEELGIGRSTRERVQADAEAILRERGAPMRVQDIHAEFIRRGVPLPGRGLPANIIAHLAVSDRFSRHGRGIWGLAERDRPIPSVTPATSERTEETGPINEEAKPPEGDQRIASK
jgi:hypothetical protein